MNAGSSSADGRHGVSRSAADCAGGEDEQTCDGSDDTGGPPEERSLLLTLAQSAAGSSAGVGIRVIVRERSIAWIREASGTSR